MKVALSEGDRKDWSGEETQARTGEPGYSSVTISEEGLRMASAAKGGEGRWLRSCTVKMSSPSGPA